MRKIWRAPTRKIRQRKMLRLLISVGQSKKEGSFRNLADGVEVECERAWSERFGKNVLN